MGWKGTAHKIYEARVLEDCLSRLMQKLAVTELPFSKDELHTLAKRARESFRNGEKKKERLDRYKTHLSKIYGTGIVETVSATLEEINNEIGYEEK
jgi:hypothetical protein